MVLRYGCTLACDVSAVDRALGNLDIPCTGGGVQVTYGVFLNAFYTGGVSVRSPCKFVHKTLLDYIDTFVLRLKY